MRNTRWKPPLMDIPFNGTKIFAPTTCHYSVITDRSWRSTLPLIRMVPYVIHPYSYHPRRYRTTER